ncbi:MAG: peptidylprolyl isomerase [Thermoplasmata archaeon]
MSEEEGADKHHGKGGHTDAAGVHVKEGDVVLAEFDAWIHDSNELFDTTSEERAKENNIYNEKMTYGPQPLIVGKGRLFPGLDESMLKAEIGKEVEVIIPPEKAAGPRNPKLVELRPLREFVKQEIEPRVGLEVTVKGKPAIITAVTAGRVRLDFNNRLAGRTLRYRYKIVEKPTKPTEIVKLLIRSAYGTSEGFEVEHHGKDFRIKLSDSCKYDQRWMIAKYRLLTDLREVLDADRISFVEEYERPKKEQHEEGKEEGRPSEPVESQEKKSEERAPEELTEEDRRST